MPNSVLSLTVIILDNEMNMQKKVKEIKSDFKKLDEDEKIDIFYEIGKSEEFICMSELKVFLRGNGY